MVEHLRAERGKLGEKQKPEKAPKVDLTGKNTADVMDLLGLVKT